MQESDKIWSRNLWSRNEKMARIELSIKKNICELVAF
jgi:hypothetical protein